MHADEIIAKLALEPHPEGGWYRETYRDTPADNATQHPRSPSTLIWFLLKRGEQAHWHRVDAVEYWLWHAGAPLELSTSSDGEGTMTLILGNNLDLGEIPHAVVPKDAWQAAKTLGDFTLVSCIVAPGFEFSGFQIAEKGWAPMQGNAE